MYDDAARGDRIADRVVAFVGSWRFLGIQSVLVAIWIAANVWLLSQPFDPYPFILLNLAFSTQAAYAAPLKRQPIAQLLGLEQRVLQLEEKILAALREDPKY